MANPQIENGYTKVANELLDAWIKISMSEYEGMIFLYIIRKTYGFNKKEDWISSNQIVIETGILKQNVSRTLKKLHSRKMIIRNGRLIGIQKDYELWKSNPIRLPSNLLRLPEKLSPKITKVISRDYKSNLARVPQKTKEKIHIYKEDSPQIELARYLYMEIKEKNKYAKCNYQVWAKEMDSLLTEDFILMKDIFAVIDWCFKKDKYWIKYILSAKSFKNNFSKMYGQMQSVTKEESFTKPLKEFKKEE